MAKSPQKGGRAKSPTKSARSKSKKKKNKRDIKIKLLINKETGRPRFMLPKHFQNSSGFHRTLWLDDES